MGKSKTGGGGNRSKNSNDDRRNQKSWKKHQGVSDKAHPGKTVNGYSPAALARRAARRAAAAVTEAS